MFLILPEKSLNIQILTLKVIVKSLFLEVFIVLDSELSSAIKDEKNGIPCSTASCSVYISDHWELCSNNILIYLSSQIQGDESFIKLPNTGWWIFHYWFLMNQSAEYRMKSHSTVIRSYHNSWCNFDYVCFLPRQVLFSFNINYI